MFGPTLFGEPAWDLLLDLYIARGQGRSVSMLSASLSASVSLPNGLGWVAFLEAQGFVERNSVGGDEAFELLTLTDGGFERMTVLLQELA